MTNESQPIEDPREVKRVDQLERGDIVVDEFTPGEYLYREVRHVEPINNDPGRVLIVFRGGETVELRGASDVDIAGYEEHEKHLATVRAEEKRKRLRAGLLRLVELLDEGLPVPAAIGVDLRLFAAADDVHAWATALDVEAVDEINQHGHSVKVRRHPLIGERNFPDVEVDVWHLGDRPKLAAGHTGTTACCTYGCPAVES